ncbi:MAG: NADH-quinone oxidoreductase subunit NuoI [Syntrophaceae bacterium]|nr:NADH-quinone oxidoreductase subunit NuoI [Syntrophaceae bacterium]
MSKALLKGLALIVKTFFRPPVTLEYPDEKRPVPDRFRGRPALVARADGAPRCVACGLCEKICPSLCITVVAETGPEGTRSLARYRLDLNRCSFCGLCVEACPVEAIVMSGEYELASGSREPLVLDEGRLLAAPDRPGEERP